MANGSRSFTSPVFLGTAFLIFALAILEKLLNLFGWDLPLGKVYPRQILDWAVALLIFEIALTLRQLVELKRDEQGTAQPLTDPEQHPH